MVVVCKCVCVVDGLHGEIELPAVDGVARGAREAQQVVQVGLRVSGLLFVLAGSLLEY